MNPADILDALENCTDPNVFDKLLLHSPQNLIEAGVPNELLIFKDAAALKPPPAVDLPCGHTEEGRALFGKIMEEMWQHYYLNYTIIFNSSGNCEYTVYVKRSSPIHNSENYLEFVRRCIKTRLNVDFNEEGYGWGITTFLKKGTDPNSGCDSVERCVIIPVISKHCVDPGQKTEDETI